MYDRFGMFIHWGLYAIPARGEWVRSIEKISVEDYQQYFDEFNPTDYNPKEWAKLAKKAGMKYAVMTAKHHDGFCLFDSKFTEYKATNTLAKRDLLREYVDAFREEGIKVGFYYSIIDWYHPDYPAYGDAQHPMRDNIEFKDKEHDWDNYLKYMHNQVHELMKNYGKIDIMWFDFSYDEFVGEKWEATKLIKMIRGINPDIIIDDRLAGSGATSVIMDEEPPYYAGDFESPEQIIPAGGLVDSKNRPIPWESCITLNGHWGYSRSDKNYKSAAYVVRMLAECVSKNGNLLLNVGPTAKGEIPPESVEILEKVGKWMHGNSDSIYGCGAIDLPKPEWGRYTYNKKTNKLYAHIYENGAFSYRFEGFADKIKKARVLYDGSEVKISRPWFTGKESADDTFIEFGTEILDVSMGIVIELTLK